MELIKNFDIDSFLKTVWVSKKAKDVWVGVIPQVNTLIHLMEVESVVAGHRRCSWQTIDERVLIEQTSEWEKQGLYTIPIKRVGQFGGFAHKHAPIIPGEPCNVCVIISKSYDDCRLFRKAFEENDNYTQGILLGYPECCSKFFCDVWKEGYYDPIWQSALNTYAKNPDSIINGGMSEKNEYGENVSWMKIKCSPHANAILRYVGVRTCFHLPCSFDCEESIKISKQRLELAKKKDADLVILLEALMRMPHSWDCYHGLAVVRTPIFYVITSSVPSVKRHIVEIEGDFIPKEAAKGLIFPFTEVK